jgi:hypothetical protein
MMTIGEMITPKEARELAKASDDCFTMFEQIDELIRSEASQGKINCSYDVPEDFSGGAISMVVKQLKDFGYIAEACSSITKPHHRRYWININWREVENEDSD